MADLFADIDLATSEVAAFACQGDASAPPTPGGHAGCGKPSETWRVVDDLPQQIPVSRREIEVLETFLGPLLDEFIGDRHAKK